MINLFVIGYNKINNRKVDGVVMKNKKPLIAVLVLFLVIGFTFALFNSSSKYDNNFNVGEYNVVTNETITAPDDWMPGDTISKSITATNNGDIDVAFRVKYTESWEDSNGNDITATVPSGTVMFNFTNQNEWIYNSNDGYYYYKYVIKPNDVTSSFISGITLNPDLYGNMNCSMDGDTYNCTSNLDGLASAKYSVNFTKETVQYDKYKEFWNTNVEIIEKPPLVQIMNSERNKDNLQVGDEICINGATQECFNFIGYDGNNIKLLSKYNLNVGNNIQPGAEGVQNSLALGANEDSSTKVNNYYPATVAFSDTNYWSDGSNLKSKYGSDWNTNNIYDTDYNEASGDNYSVAYYVENYKNTLESYGLTVNDARLLTYSESIDESIGCDGDNRKCPTGFITNTSFWLGSANGNSNVWLVISGGVFYYFDFGSNSFYGVRPVIVISKSDI